MVDALQHIIGSVCFGSVNFVSVVNQAGAKWFDFRPTVPCTLNLDTILSKSFMVFIFKLVYLGTIVNPHLYSWFAGIL